MKQEDILPALDGELGDHVQFMTLKATIAAMIERAFASYRIIGGGNASASSANGMHNIHAQDNRSTIRRVV